jgi:hypothetical protein
MTKSLVRVYDQILLMGIYREVNKIKTEKDLLIRVKKIIWPIIIDKN